MEDFAFTATEVADLLGLQTKTANFSNKSSINYVCPICGRPKFNCNLRKNVFRCPACDFGGGMLDVYRTLRNLSSNGAAYKEIVSRLNRDNNYDNSTDYQLRKYDEKNNRTRSASKAKREVIDKTYRTLLSFCKLSKNHYIDLRQRGLSEKRIREHKYKSVPTLSSQKIIQRLMEEDCHLKGVPGFYYNKKLGRWEMAIRTDTSGFFCPCIDIDGYITGLQIRLDKKRGKKRYIWFSSNEMNLGCSSGTPVHYIPKADKSTLYLTEGSLKANIAAELSKKTFLAVAGVNCQKPLDETLIKLKARGLTKIVDCFDADCKNNPYVEKARQKIKEKCQILNIEYHRLNWDLNFGKGIDDFLLNQRRKNGRKGIKEKIL